ncbi:hydrogenase iron-sulfur subunit, partial [Chloroflexota bacterium]
SARESGRGNYDLRFAIPKSTLNRRQFLKTALPRYEMKPGIEVSKCSGTDKCRLCLDICSHHAISHQKDTISIDGSICSGCGACMAICPNQAISYPAYSVEELIRELEGLLYSEGDCLDSRIIALYCLNYLSDSAEEIRYPSTILPIEVPCLSVVSPLLLLRAFEMGAQGLVLIANEDKCSSESCPSIIDNNVRFVQSILNAMNVESTRIKLFEITDNNRINVESGLHIFAEEMAGLTPTPFKFNDCISHADDKSGIHALIDRMGKKTVKFDRDTIYTSGVSLGKITIDSVECTVCGLCSLNCPTSALIGITADNDDYQLLFKYESCIACGVCANVCPEKCIQLHHILELDKLCAQESMLVKTGVEKCRSCGRDIAPAAMIDSLRAKLQDAGCDNDYLDLCPECRASTQGSGRIEQDNLIRI